LGAPAMTKTSWLIVSLYCRCLRDNADVIWDLTWCAIFTKILSWDQSWGKWSEMVNLQSPWNPNMPGREGAEAGRGQNDVQVPE
jgi:hypothetical protein